MNNIKPFWKSSIVWAAFIPALLEIIDLLSTSPIIPEKYQGLLILISSLLVIILRFVSSGTQISINGKTVREAYEIKENKVNSVKEQVTEYVEELDSKKPIKKVLKNQINKILKNK